jgi:hypothetical protein
LRAPGDVCSNSNYEFEGRQFRRNDFLACPNASIENSRQRTMRFAMEEELKEGGEMREVLDG